MTIDKATPEMSGCWVGGHVGHYGQAHVIVIALDHGMRAHALGDVLMDISGEYFLNGYHEDIDWAADKAEEWLNDNVAPEGYAFGWFDGEFYLWSYNQWDLADC